MKRDPEYYDSIEDYTADVIAAREAYAADRAAEDERLRGELALAWSDRSAHAWHRDAGHKKAGEQ